MIHLSFRKFYSPRSKKNTKIKINDIIILPIDDDTYITKQIRDVSRSILDKYNILKYLTNYNNYFIKVSTSIKKYSKVSEAYKIWSEEGFLKTEAPFNLPHVVNNPICPPHVILVRLECVNKYSTTYRDGAWGFEGYILFMLVDIKNFVIWDARGEKVF